MRIDAYAQVQQMYKPKTASKVEKSTSTSFADQVQISSAGKEIQTAKTAVLASPDVREELIAPIRTSIQNGTYEVSKESFAQKVIEKYNQTLA